MTIAAIPPIGYSMTPGLNANGTDGPFTELEKVAVRSLDVRDYSDRLRVHSIHRHRSTTNEGSTGLDAPTYGCDYRRSGVPTSVGAANTPSVLEGKASVSTYRNGIVFYDPYATASHRGVVRVVGNVGNGDEKHSVAVLNTQDSQFSLAELWHLANVRRRKVPIDASVIVAINLPPI
ncbi:hypothetical protein GLOTRDRAFT_95571 [Gloeophyllum trabeum ATCC 11539]|uniref:Uncharacterized protein n=1 Tax=Gloeophyllum trabeum (strain ATCC 11539 / FP-39264 / Madison 617) TaxID=670483 RepID=S7RJA8_GLOTA|nr:uncharacterized protein GLOTRDRAFT_95571 [Gloeophyllum trabeum ATCC 11539]EPQ52709.1 hypothetical protein GLOTRDRAFT_95571 [Gloeophyllum trabeum ATCC 11539]